MSKNNIIALFSVIAVVGLIVSNAQLRNELNKKGNRVLASEESINSTQEVVPEQNVTYPSSSFPHSTCDVRLLYTTTPSHTYNRNVPYNLDMYGGNLYSGFVDVNGDNLPDYVRVHNTINGGDNIVQNYIACVYLNNGSGWTKAYECAANTEIVGTTGQIVRSDYYGDCAGAPASSEEKNSEEIKE